MFTKNFYPQHTANQYEKKNEKSFENIYIKASTRLKTHNQNDTNFLMKC